MAEDSAREGFAYRIHPRNGKQMPSARSGEIENPKIGDSVISKCGMIKVSVADDGSFPVTKLTKKRGSFNIQLYYEGKQEPDTIVFRSEDPAIPLYRRSPSTKLVKIRIVTNPI